MTLNWPERVLLPFGDALQPWRAVVCSPSMPTVDEEAVLSQLVWAVGHECHAEVYAENTVAEMAFGDTMYEADELEPEQRQDLFNVTAEMACRLITELQDVKAYAHGVFPYELEGILNDDTLVLRRLRST